MLRLAEVDAMAVTESNVPTRADIVVHDGNLDEEAACRHFLGKTVEQAERLFRENSLYYQEDLLWMGPAAFRYYAEAAVRYLESDTSAGDTAMLSGFASVLELRSEWEFEELVPVAGLLSDACDYVARNVSKFLREDGGDELYGDLSGRYAALRESFAAAR